MPLANPEMINHDAINIPEHVVVTEYRILPRKLSAIRLERNGSGVRMGAICELPAGLKVGLCGCGYSSRTIKVHSEDGGFYFVFREDLIVSDADNVRA